MNFSAVSVPNAPPSVTALVQWGLPPLPVLPVAAIVMAGLYCWGLFRIRRGDRIWPRWRALSFLSGCAMLAAVTGLQIELYGYSVFSVFMFQHLTLSMAIPPLLVVGSPGVLLLRSVSHRGAGRVVLAVALGALRSGSARAVLHPAVTIPLFLFSYYGLYLSSLFDTIAATALGHTAIEVFFLASGLLFIIPVLSVGPLPVRQSNLGRLFDLFVEMPLHVFFGVILMMTTTPMLTTFASPPESWGLDPVADQKLAGALAWSYGEPVALLVVVIFCIRWHREETTRSMRTRTDTDEDTAHLAYNDYLRALASGARTAR